jgi:uncharacterized protein YbjT (DUF2867 family)
VILVTGGTGFVGSEIVKELLEGSSRVRILVRHPEKARALAGPLCQLHEGDVTSTSSVLKAITPEIETVIHLVGILAESALPSARSMWTARGMSSRPARKWAYPAFST